MSRLTALYATCHRSEFDGRTTTFRIGLPASEAVTYARHERFDNAHYRGRRRLSVMHNGRSYPVKFLEVREVDAATGRGLGSERHWTARKVPVGALHIIPDAPHELNIYCNRRWTATDKWGCTLVTYDQQAFIGYGTNGLKAAAAARLHARKAGAL